MPCLLPIHARALADVGPGVLARPREDLILDRVEHLGDVERRFGALRVRVGHAAQVVWTISRSMVVCRITSSGTEPTIRPASVLSPRLPTTSRSASCFSTMRF